MATLDDILTGCKRFHKADQKSLYDRYAPAMKGLCHRYVRDNETVKDILQEGFIKVFCNIHQYNGNGSFEGWIKRIFINTALNHLKKNQKNHQFIKLEDIDEGSYSKHDDLTGLDSRPEFDHKDLQTEQMNFSLVQSAEFSEKELLHILKKLPDMYRLVFNLFFIENYKHEEIANVLNIDISTSRTRLMRARNMVQKEIYEISIEKLNLSHAQGKG